MTDETIRAGATGVEQPFHGVCDLYVVALDRDSRDDTERLARTLTRQLAVSACATEPFMLDVSLLDRERGQLDVRRIWDALIENLADEHGSRPATVLAVTALDVFNPERPDWRFVFASGYGNAHHQAVATLSTARLGQDDGRSHRLVKLALRYTAFFHFGLARSDDRRTVRYGTILRHADIDALAPALAVPEPTAAGLARLRQLYLAQRPRGSTRPASTAARPPGAARSPPPPAPVRPRPPSSRA